MTSTGRPKGTGDRATRDASVEVRTSSIEGRGVFAAAAIKKGRTVIAWRPARRITEGDIEHMGEAERHYLTKGTNDDFLLMGEPERYVNHSCSPNTEVQGEADVALRDIKEGEEITSDYGQEGALVGFLCRCGSRDCKGWVGPKE